MADKKISALTAATTPLAGTEVLPIVQSSTTKKVSVADLTAGRDTSVAKLTASDNIVIATAGKGIDFSADAHAAGMTSELLDDYEEGTWTPNQGSGLTVTGTFSSAGAYTKVGRIVTVRAALYATTSISASSAGQMTSNLPFAPDADTAGAYFNGTLAAGGQIDAAPTGVYAVGAIAATSGIYFSATYVV